MAQLLKYLVSSRLLIVSLVLIFNLATLALASSYTETYVTYQNVTRIVESVKTRRNCGWWSCATEYYREYHTHLAVESVTATRCSMGRSPYPDCNDTDECQEGTSNCSQICSNTVGSYTCSCDAGYRLASNGLSCQDIDECTEGRSACEQICSNIVGNYTCSCRTGYRLAPNGLSCNDIDECTAQLDNCTALENFTCENTIGGYQCVVCETGFEQVGPRECRDINECETSTNNCTLYENLICENIIGSYKCHSDSRWMSETTVRLVIIITVGVVGLILIIIAVVCFVKCAMKRRINKQGPTANNEDMAAENLYCNVAETTIATSSKSEISQSQASSEIVYEVVADVRRQATSRLTSSKNVYVEAANVCKKTKTKPKINDSNTQETCRSTTASCSIPEEKSDLNIGEATMDSTYQELSAVAEMENVYEPIKKKP